MKKIVSIFLALALILTCGATTSANTYGSLENFKSVRQYTTNQFSDVPDSEWYAQSVKIAYELSLVNGTSNIEFSPDDNITIAETITLASRLNNIYYGSDYLFTTGDVWYQTYIDYAVENGIIKENEYSEFDKFATRSQFAQIFASALPEEALKTINYIDDASIPDVDIKNPHYDAIYKLYRAGILTGNDSKGTFTPDTNIQRSAVAAIVSRMVDTSQRKSIQLINSSKENETELTSEEISQKCSPAVFYIKVYSFNGRPLGTGSGFFITADGIAVTNYHVVANSIYREITMTDGKVYKDVSIIDADEEKDLALLKVEGSGFPYLEMGDSSQINQGQQVYAIGSPLGLSNTMSQGIISNTSRILDDVNYIQISVPINHGSSGGALVNKYGKAIGVTSGSFETIGDLNLAIPVNYVKALNVDSEDSYFVWEDEYYPGFSKVIDFNKFSGLERVSIEETIISYTEVYDIFDFYSVGPYDESDCYAYTIYLYEQALEENGLTKEIISDTVTGFESEDEMVLIKRDFDEGIITIFAIKMPETYDGCPSLIDFGWYSNLPMAYEPYYIDDSVVYGYNWRSYYYRYEFEELLSSYFGLLLNIGYEFVADDKDAGTTYYLFEGDNLSIVFMYTDKELFIDIAPE